MSLKSTETNTPNITVQKTPSHTKAYYPNIAKKFKGKKRKLEMCVICIQHCTSSSSMKAEKCEHAVCDSCLRAYFDNALNESRYTVTSFEKIECPSPDCKATFLSERVIRNIYTAKQRNDWWTSVAMKTNIENKVICPFQLCKAIFDADVILTKKCTFAECYECRRGFCTACQSPWHPGVMKIVDDQEELKKILDKAKESKWTRCPKCGHLVERMTGCTFMLCVCGTEFCYRCGGYSVGHACSNKCHILTEKNVQTLRSQMFVPTNDDLTNKIRKTN